MATCKTAGTAIMTTIGIQNNNPLNLVHVPKNKWQGLPDPPNEGRFSRSVSPVWGIRAACVNLIGYQDRQGIRTIKGLVEKWAPFTENNTRAYVKDVAQRAGFG